MKKIIFSTSILVALSGSALLNNANAQCTVDEFIGSAGTSCVYYQGGCYYKVTAHSFLFGLFRWNTEKLISCDEPIGEISEDISSE